jgi:hypothetical protein
VVSIVVDIMSMDSNIADTFKTFLVGKEVRSWFDGISSRGKVRIGWSTFSGQVEAMFSFILYRRWPTLVRLLRCVKCDSSRTSRCDSISLDKVIGT